MKILTESEYMKLPQSEDRKDEIGELFLIELLESREDERENIFMAGIVKEATEADSKFNHAN